LATADRIYKTDYAKRQTFLYDLLKKTKEDRESLMRKLNKTTWQQLLDIFGLTAYTVGSVTTTGKVPNPVPALAETYAWEKRMADDAALIGNAVQLALKSIVLFGGISLINKI
jgi:hypothetical protein